MPLDHAVSYPANADSANDRSSTLPVLTLAALGVVFGDIGTSPLYAFKEAFSSARGLPLDQPNVLAALSLIFWTIAIVVSLKYVAIVLRFDNSGEGGILALLALASRITREQPRVARTVVLLGIFGASLFYGDAIITPAISVLSAVEGLSVATPAFHNWIATITIAVLVALFYLQKRGTGAVGRLFGPIMVLWFIAIGTLGTLSIIQTPQVLYALDPRHALDLMTRAPGLAFLVLGAVFLAVTGAEALYADMGHFGPSPIRLAWFGLAFPALILNYFGQGALLIRQPAALKNPFYLLANENFLLPLVFLATAATVIASQATISGAFSLTQQASRLGYLPRIPARHTSAATRGQIYIAQINWLLLILIILLVLGFKTSDALASAYGVAVSGTMVLTTALVGVIVWRLSGKARLLTLCLLGGIGTLELVFFAANATKITEGGWIPLLCGGCIFVLLTTWRRAEIVLATHEMQARIPVEKFPAMCDSSIARVPGTAVYMSPHFGWIPTVLLHNLKHNKVLHERVVFLTIIDEDVPRVADRERTEVHVVERGHMYSVGLHYGFMEDPDVPRGLKLLERHGLRFQTEETTFFLGKSTIARATRPGLFTWRRELFRWMQRNSPSTAEYFNLVPNRVIELGTRLSI